MCFALGRVKNLFSRKVQYTEFTRSYQKMRTIDRSSSFSDSIINLGCAETYIIEVDVLKNDKALTSSKEGRTVSYHGHRRRAFCHQELIDDFKILEYDIMIENMRQSGIV